MMGDDTQTLAAGDDLPIAAAGVLLPAAAPLRCPEATALDDAEEDGADDGHQPIRRCILTGVRQFTEGMIRFVLGPDGTVVPDLAESLPGRGVWLAAAPFAVSEAARKGCFARAFRGRVSVPGDLAARLPALLSRRCVELLGLLRRAGLAVAGFEKVRERLQRARPGSTAYLLAADDGAADGCQALASMATAPTLGGLSGDEIGAAFGRDRAVHVWVGTSPLSDKLRRDLQRLAALRSAATGGTPLATAAQVR